jgi:SAM-dependent methyltransferase
VNSSEKDYLWLNISTLPYFRGLLRAVEARVYERLELPEPSLDLGCGDGHFSNIAFDTKITLGLDPWTGPVHLARRDGKYQHVVQALGDHIPSADGFYASAVSNSVLEHIPDLDPVLEELNRVLKPNAPFIFCVPNENFLANLSISNWLDRIGLHGLANQYTAFFNRISRHHHCDPYPIWQERLQKHGFAVDHHWDYFSPAATSMLEWGHYFGVPSLICHFLFRKWILVPTRWNLALTMRIVRKYYLENEKQTKGSYSFYLARKTSS